MKKHPCSSILCVSVLLTTWIILYVPYAYGLVVTGQNNAEIDIKAIQDAVDKGGTVLLKGTFNFGLKGNVIIKNDIAIIGEADPKGVPLTKIMGGQWTFQSKLPATDPSLLGSGPWIKVKNVHFDGATWTPMHFPYTCGAVITGNKITNVQPYEMKFKWQEKDTTIWVQAGAFFGTRYAHREKIIPKAVTGSLVFENNTVDLKCNNPKDTMAQGAFFLWTWGATIEVKKNIFRNISRNSIETLDNYIDEEGRGSVTITENHIITPKEGCPFPGPSSYPNGIAVGWFLDRSGGSDLRRNSKITVANNIVQTHGELSTAIFSSSDGTSILGNKVDLRGGPKNKGITQMGSGGFIAKNKIDGSGAWAISALPADPLKGSSNTFALNDFKGFNAVEADFTCIGNKNMLVGSKCKVVDKGKENMVLVMH